MQFWPILGPYDPHRGPLQYQQSTFKGSYSLKSLYKLVLPENRFISIFFEVKMFEKCPKCLISCNFDLICGPYDPFKSPLHYQRSTLKGLYSFKIIHKIVLPENEFISIFFELKMFEKCPKCHISCNFGPFWDHITHSEAPYSTKKVLLRAHILPKVAIN